MQGQEFGREGADGSRPPKAFGRVVRRGQEAAEAGGKAREEEEGCKGARTDVASSTNMSRKEDDTELDFACEAVINRASEHNLVALLDKSTNGQCGSIVVTRY